MTKKPRIVIFASGTKGGGGSGAENLVVSSRGDNPVLFAEIVALVSNHEYGGVRRRADALGVPFVHFKTCESKFAMAARYQKIARDTHADFAVLSGWLKPVYGLEASNTINIHPALLSFNSGEFGGKGLYGIHVHQAVKEALDAGRLGPCPESGFTMHFVTEEYDQGPAFAEIRVPIHRAMYAEDIALVVNRAEHEWQPYLTNLVVNRHITLTRGHVTWPHGFKYRP